MNGDSSKRGRPALPVTTGRSLVPAKLDLAKIDAAIARGRASVAQGMPVRPAPPAPAVPVAAPAPAPAAAPIPRVEQVRLHAHCSATGKSNIIVAERRDNALRFIGNETPGPGRGDGALPAYLSDKYDIDLGNWSCQHCRSEGMWVCGCGKFDGVVHCHGNRADSYHCACGRWEERSFKDGDLFALRGQSMGVGLNGSSVQRGVTVSSRKGR